MFDRCQLLNSSLSTAAIVSSVPAMRKLRMECHFGLRSTFYKQEDLFHSYGRARDNDRLQHLCLPSRYQSHTCTHLAPDANQLCHIPISYPLHSNLVPIANQDPGPSTLDQDPQSRILNKKYIYIYFFYIRLLPSMIYCMHKVPHNIRKS